MSGGIAFAKELRALVQWLETNGDPTLPYTSWEQWRNGAGVTVERRRAAKLNRTFGMYLEIDHLVEQRFLGHLPSASLDPDEWDSKIVPKNKKVARVLNKLRRGRPFPYVHSVKTFWMRRMIPHGMEGLFTPQEIWDAHAWTFKRLGLPDLEDELERLKIYFRNAKVRFRIPAKDPSLRSSWKKKAAFRPAGTHPRKKKASLPRDPMRTDRRGLDGGRPHEAARATARDAAGPAQRGTGGDVPIGKQKTSGAVQLAKDLTMHARSARLAGHLRSVSGAVFGGALAAYGSHVRAKLNERNFRTMLERELNKADVQAAIERELEAFDTAVHRPDLPHYLHLYFDHRFLGSYELKTREVVKMWWADEQNRSIEMEAIQDLTFVRAEVNMNAKPDCDESYFEVGHGDRGYRHQRCSLPVPLQPELERRLRLEHQQRKRALERQRQLHRQRAFHEAQIRRGRVESAAESMVVDPDTGRVLQRRYK